MYLDFQSNHPSLTQVLSSKSGNRERGFEELGASTPHTHTQMIFLSFSSENVLYLQD